MHPNVSNQSFWADMADTMFPPERVAAADAEVEAYSTLLALDRPLDILDMPCGVGRHSHAWARRGHRVTGVDITPCYLDRARASSGGAGDGSRRVDRSLAPATPLAAPTTPTFILADMATFDAQGRFDLLTNLWTSFGYADTPEGDEAVARSFFRALRPGGRLLMDLAGKEIVVRRFQTHRWHPRNDGTFVLEEARPIDAWRRIEMRWVAITPGQSPTNATVQDHTMRLRLYSAQELADLLTHVGFTHCREFGSAAGTPYDHEATRLVVIATKP